MIDQTDYFFFFQFIFKNSSQWKQVEISRPTDPSKKCPKEEHFEFMLISYCRCSSEKVCLHLFSWPCLQWMSSSFAYRFKQRWLIKLIKFFSSNLFSKTVHSGNKSRSPGPQTPSKKCPKEEHFEFMLISYCSCSSEKVWLHLFSWPCLQWMSSSFAYLTNVPSYECTITCWCFRWKEWFSGLWNCPTYRVGAFVIFSKVLTHGLSLKIEIWPLFVLF